jgi:hypothetical protein
VAPAAMVRRHTSATQGWSGSEMSYCPSEEVRWRRRRRENGGPAADGRRPSARPWFVGRRGPISPLSGPAPDPEPGHSAFERRGLEAQAPGGAPGPRTRQLVLSSDGANVLDLERLERHPRLWRLGRRHLGQFYAEARLGRHDDGPLDHVAELADVAGPRVLLQLPHRVLRHRLDSACRTSVRTRRGTPRPDRECRRHARWRGSTVIGKTFRR